MHCPSSDAFLVCPPGQHHTDSQPPTISNTPLGLSAQQFNNPIPIPSISFSTSNPGSPFVKQLLTLSSDLQIHELKFMIPSKVVNIGNVPCGPGIMTMLPSYRNQ
jgi:hypothetical protein